MGFLADLRYSVRLLARTPGFTFVAVFILALAIGANTLMFSVLDAVLLRPLPYKDPGSLELIWRYDLHSKGKSHVSLDDFQEWKSRNRGFTDMAAWMPASFDLEGRDYAERINGMRVTPNLFSFFGVDAVRGRLFLPEDGRTGHDDVIVISHALWQTRFHGDPAAIGSTMSLSMSAQPRRTYTIIGVLPPSFAQAFPRNYGNIWTPIALDTTESWMRRGGGLAVIGRRMPEVTAAQAAEDMKSIAAARAVAHPESHAGRSIVLESFQDNLIRDWPRLLFSLAGAVAFVLLIGCANVANLMLARASDRERELTVRAAIGAARWPLIRLLLAESSVIAVCGGAAGAALSFWGMSAVKTILPAGLPRAETIGVDWRGLVFAFAAAASCAVIFGLLPAVRASRPDLNASLKSGVIGGTRPAARLRHALVVAEIALGLVLLTGAGLMINSFIRLLNVDTGMNVRDVLAIETGLPRGRYPADADRRMFVERLLEGVRAVPGVRLAGISDFRPMGNSMHILMEKPSAPGRRFPGNKEAVAGDYFAAMGTTLVRGRDFGPHDVPEAPPVAVISESAAREYFAGEEPLGKQISIVRGTELSTREIVGVVKDVRRWGPDRDARPSIYVPMAQGPVGSTRIDLVVRTQPGVAPMSIAEPVRREIAAIDRTLAVDRISTMDEIAGRLIAQPRMLTVLIGAFGLLALALTATGVYGVMAYTVRLKLHEIGVRMVLGADGASVLRMMLVRGAKLAAIGIVLGAAGAWGATRLLTAYLFEVKPGDPWTFFAAAAFLGAVTLAANYLPARKAAKVDPLVSIRYE